MGKSVHNESQHYNYIVSLCLLYMWHNYITVVSNTCNAWFYQLVYSLFTFLGFVQSSAVNKQHIGLTKTQKPTPFLMITYN